VSFLLDTAVVSELVRKSPSAAVLKWIDGQDEASLYLSVLTIGELEKGVARLPVSTRRNRLQSWVRRDLVERFGGRLLPIDTRTAARWGSVTGESERRGKPLPVIERLVRAGRGKGLSDERLYEVLAARTGISGDARLADALRQGKDEYVLSVVRGV